VEAQGSGGSRAGHGYLATFPRSVLVFCFGFRPQNWGQFSRPPAAKRLEELTKDTPAWYAGVRARVEAKAALEQPEELSRVLEEWGER
jgi:hypothetical protein